MDTQKLKSPKPKTQGKNTQTCKIQFAFFAPLSLTVQVAGTFNDWDPKRGSMKKDANGNWSGAFELKPGRYEYRFVVDGNWENDQNNNEIIPNALGTFNNVIAVH